MMEDKEIIVQIMQNVQQSRKAAPFGPKTSVEFEALHIEQCSVNVLQFKLTTQTVKKV